MDEYYSNVPLPGDNFDNIKEIIQKGKDPCLYSICCHCYDRIDYKNWCSGELATNNMDIELNHYEDIVHFSQDDEASHADDVGNEEDSDNVNNVDDDNSVSDDNSSTGSEISDDSSTESIDSDTRERMFHFGHEIGNRLVDDFIGLVGNEELNDNGSRLIEYFEIKYDDILAFLSENYGDWRNPPPAYNPVLSTIEEDVNIDSEIADESTIESEYVYRNKIRDDFI